MAAATIGSLAAIRTVTWQLAQSPTVHSTGGTLRGTLVCLSQPIWLAMHAAYWIRFRRENFFLANPAARSWKYEGRRRQLKRKLDG